MNDRSQGAVALPSAAPNVHNGTYTVEGDGKHFTVKLHTAQKGKLAGKRILSLLTGPDNESSYTGVAFWDDEKRRAHVWKRHRGPASSLPIDGYHRQERGWSSIEVKLSIWCDLVVRGDGTGEPSLIESTGEHKAPRGFYGSHGWSVLLSGRCVKCNRKLTDPESIRTGIGPKCGGRS